MPVSSYTTLGSVRAALGVTAEDLDDDVLTDEVFELDLNRELDAIGVGLRSAYSDILQVADASRTAVQASIYAAVRLFSTYAVAKHLTISLPMFGAKDMSDGVAQVSRFQQNPFVYTIKQVNNKYVELRDELYKLYASYTSSSSTVADVTLMRVASRSIDPITGS